MTFEETAIACLWQPPPPSASPHALLGCISLLCPCRGPATQPHTFAAQSGTIKRQGALFVEGATCYFEPAAAVGDAGTLDPTLPHVQGTPPAHLRFSALKINFVPRLPCGRPAQRSRCVFGRYRGFAFETGDVARRSEKPSDELPAVRAQLLNEVNKIELQALLQIATRPAAVPIRSGKTKETPPGKTLSAGLCCLLLAHRERRKGGYSRRELLSRLCRIQHAVFSQSATLSVLF